jgi:hypothetical protein
MKRKSVVFSQTATRENQENVRQENGSLSGKVVGERCERERADEDFHSFIHCQGFPHKNAGNLFLSRPLPNIGRTQKLLLLQLFRFIFLQTSNFIYFLFVFLISNNYSLGLHYLFPHPSNKNNFPFFPSLSFVRNFPFSR